MTYSDVQVEYPSNEKDGLYDGSSQPTSTEVTALVTRVDNVVEIACADETQAIKDEVILLLTGRRLIALNEYNDMQAKNTLEPGTKRPLMDWSIGKRNFLLEALEASKGSTYPRISTIDLY